MSNEFELLFNEDDVVSVAFSDKVFIDESMFKVSQFLDESKRILVGKYSKEDVWLVEGIDCEILQLGAKKWQKGKVRLKINLEFSAEEPEVSQPESPLDDIRQMTSENS